MQEYHVGEYTVFIPELMTEAGVGSNPEKTDLFLLGGFARLQQLPNSQLKINGPGGLVYELKGKQLYLSLLDDES